MNKRKERISMRMARSVMDALDAAAKAQRRSRSNYVDWILAKALAVPQERLAALQSTSDDKRHALLAFRLTAATVAKLDRAAAAEKRTRSELAAALLTGALLPTWEDDVERLTPRRARPKPAPQGVFA